MPECDNCRRETPLYVLQDCYGLCNNCFNDSEEDIADDEDLERE